MSSDSRLPDEPISPQYYAALCVAIGWLRGALGDVIDGEIDKEHLTRLLEATSTAQIAKALGKEEGDLFLDWNRYLSEKQKHAIGGMKE